MCPHRPSCRPGSRVSEIASAGAGTGQLRRQQEGSRISPLPSAGHVHRPEAAAAGAGEYVPAVFLLHLGAQEPPPLPLPPGLLMFRRCRGTAGAGASLSHGSGLVGSPQAGPPLPQSLEQASRHTRVGTRPRAVPAAPGSRESHRCGRCQATSSGPAALTLGKRRAPRLRTTQFSPSIALS